MKTIQAAPLEDRSAAVITARDDAEPISSGALLDADVGRGGDSQAGWSSTPKKRNVLTPADRRARKIRTWRRRALLKRGAKLQLAMGAKAQLCSMAMLDEKGIVISWYGRARGNDHVSEEIVGRHVSLLYVPEEIAKRQPLRDLRAAKAKGSITRQAWRRRRDGSVHMSTFVIEAVTLRDGRLQGFCYVAPTVSVISVPKPAPLTDTSSVPLS